MSGIGTRIIVIGLPTIAQQLHAGAAEVVWVTQSYILVVTVSLLLIGRTADLFGRAKIYSYGFAIFSIGSALSALSLNPYQLIGFRMIQGAGAAMLTGNSSAIITDASPKNQLGMMLGVNQTAYRLGAVAGLTLSGLILSVVDWRGLFYVNIPIGIFGTIWASRRLKEISSRDKAKKMDWTGLTLFSAGMTLVLLAITFLSYGSSSSTEGIVFLAVGTALLILFARTESTARSPLLDLQLFKIRLFIARNLAQMLNAISWQGFLLLMAFYLQVGLGYSPLQAGLGILPLEVIYLVSSFVSGRLSDKYGSRGLTSLGQAVNAIAILLATTFSLHTQYLQVTVVLALAGIGNGMFNTPNVRAIMESVPANRRGIGSAFMATSFNIGYMLSYGLAILFVTFGIPYATFSRLLSSSSEQTINLTAKLEFLNGFHIASILLATIAAVTIAATAAKGKEQTLLATEA